MIIFSLIKFIVMCLCSALVIKFTEAQGNNLYLPPKEEPGYDYPKPGGPPPSKPSTPSKPSGPPSKEEVSGTRRKINVNQNSHDLNLKISQLSSFILLLS
jgi:hypothetical protein